MAAREVDQHAFKLASRGQLGRKQPCWCGSGKRYKHCHFEADQAPAAGGVQKMSEILEELATACGLRRCRGPNQASVLLQIAGMVWNATRLTGAERAAAFQAIEQGLDAGEDQELTQSLVARMTPLADQRPDDRRVVTKVEVTGEPGRWSVLAASVAV